MIYYDKCVGMSPVTFSVPALCAVQDVDFNKTNIIQFCVPRTYFLFLPYGKGYRVLLSFLFL